MLTFLLGTDSEKKGQRLKNLISDIEKKNITIRTIRITPEDVFSGTLESYVRHQSGLFAETYAIILPYLFDENSAPVLSELFKVMVDSDHYFYVLEHDMSKEYKAVLSHKDVVVHEDSQQKNKKQVITPFAITDAIIARDKKRAWITCLELRDADVAIEQVIGIVFWQIKTLYAVACAKNPSYLLPLNLKPFTLTQAKKGIQKYTTDELRHMVYDIATLISRTRRDNQDPYVAFEKYLLSTL